MVKSAVTRRVMHRQHTLQSFIAKGAKELEPQHCSAPSSVPPIPGVDLSCSALMLISANFSCQLFVHGNLKYFAPGTRPAAVAEALSESDLSQGNAFVRY